LTKNVGIKTTELDNLLAETAAYHNILHPDYGKLAARVAVTQLHKETCESFQDVISALFHYKETNGNLSKINLYR
jgi:ribonucleoside-diphosphate reductase subunit M1